MLRTLYSSVFKLLFVTTFLANQLWGQQAQEPPAPVPAQIISAKRIFISNGGEQSIYRLVRSNLYTGGPNRTYNEFYAAMKSWGRYELTSAPADADLVLEISFEVKDSEQVFKLLIIDPKTHTTLWTLREYVDPAGLAKNREKNYGLTMTLLVNNAKNLMSQPVLPPQR